MDEQIDKPVVIGLAGGIGAGKSGLAKAFAQLGCLVIDFDQEAKDQLDHPDVHRTLVEWWGNDVLGLDGHIDRAAVADRVFAAKSERERLENLIHPLIWRSKEAARREAMAAGADAVVLDAPLLLEAGLDESCDVVIFVDAPRPERLRRVIERRGWTEKEFEAREAAQWSIERKMAASDVVVNNVKAELDLRETARDMLATMGVTAKPSA